MDSLGSAPVPGVDMTPLAGGTGRDEPAERASGVRCDAGVSASLRDQLPPAVRGGLAGAWVSAVRRLPANPPIDLGPHHYAVTSLLERVRTVSSADVARIM